MSKHPSLQDRLMLRTSIVSLLTKPITLSISRSPENPQNEILPNGEENPLNTQFIYRKTEHPPTQKHPIKLFITTHYSHTFTSSFSPLVMKPHLQQKLHLHLSCVVDDVFIIHQSGCLTVRFHWLATRHNNSIPPLNIF